MSTGINLKDVRPDVQNPKGNFDLSFRRKFDHAFGEMVPFCWLPIMPDDNFDVSYDVLARMAPFVSQVYQDFTATVDFYFVPNRLIWHNFSNFMQGGYDGKKNFVHPTLNLGYIANNFLAPDSHNHLFNFFDIPNSVFTTLATRKNNQYNINALPFFAYLRLYLDHWIATGTPLNEYVQRYVNADEPICLDGDNTSNFINLLYHILAGDPSFLPPDPNDFPFSSWFHLLERLYPLDYFTMSRPDPQLGPVMTIPLQLVNTDSDGNQTFKLNQPASGSSGVNRPVIANYTVGSDSITFGPANQSGSSQAYKVTVNGSVFNNVASINDFYSAARVQELLTLYNYTGFRSDDAVAAEFDIKSKDARLHISDHIHHYQEDVNIGEVFSNSVSTAESQTRDVPGVGTAIAKSALKGRGFHFYSGEDYGFLIGVYSVYPKAGYNQGFPKIFRCLDRFDYPHPKLSQIGMEPIKRHELIADNDNYTRWDEELSYNPRYSDYKVGIDRDNGSFADSLQYMSDIRRLSSTVEFNEQFMRVIPTYNHLNRPFNNQGYLGVNRPLFCDAHFYIHANRNLPYYGLPQF